MYTCNFYATNIFNVTVLATKKVGLNKYRHFINGSYIRFRDLGTQTVENTSPLIANFRHSYRSP